MDMELLTPIKSCSSSKVTISNINIIEVAQVIHEFIYISISLIDLYFLICQWSGLSWSIRYYLAYRVQHDLYGHTTLLVHFDHLD